MLGNAMKYSGDSRDIELRLVATDGQEVIQVTDHGLGDRSARTEKNNRQVPSGPLC
jgi:signal transduction histidine kinase